MRYHIRDRPEATAQGGRRGAVGASGSAVAAGSGRKTTVSGGHGQRRSVSEEAMAGGIRESSVLQPSQPRMLTLQERRAAFGPKLPVVTRGRGGVRVSSVPLRCNPGDLRYLGGGMHLPDRDTLDLYERLKGDRATHASGSLIKGLPDDGEGRGWLDGHLYE